jgi:hypothetical protein
MPLSEHEQRILEDIERRLQQEDPRFAQQVALASALFVYHQLRRMGGEQIRAVGQGPPLPAFLARLFQRFRGEPEQ